MGKAVKSVQRKANRARRMGTRNVARAVNPAAPAAAPFQGLQSQLGMAAPTAPVALNQGQLIGQVDQIDAAPIVQAPNAAGLAALRNPPPAPPAPPAPAVPAAPAAVPAAPAAVPAPFTKEQEDGISTPPKPITTPTSVSPEDEFKKKQESMYQVNQ